MRPYDQNEPKREQIRTMFDRIAPHYDSLNHLLSMNLDRGWRKKVVRMVAEKNPSLILDLASGTGDLAIMISKKLPASKVIAADLSQKMLEKGARKVRDRGLEDRISLVQAEAEALPFDDSMFDAVTVGFGVRNFHDIEKGIEQAQRVLRPGGSLYVLEFSTPRNRIFGTLYRFYFHRVLPWIGGLVAGDRGAYIYLPKSVDEFPQGERFIHILRQAGFDHCTMKSLMNGVATIYTGTKKSSDEHNR